MVVLTQLPLKSVLRSADYTGRIAKWGTILGAFDIKYMPCTSIKGQVLANLEGGSKKLDEGLIGVASVQYPPPWELYIDGAANQRGLGVGLVLVSPERITIEKSLRLNVSATNNEAEYET